MKKGTLVYVPQKDIYGFVEEVLPSGRIKSIFVRNEFTGKFDLMEVLDLLVEAVGLVKKLIVIIKLMFGKKKTVLP